jgi:hypothetical protein
MLGGGGRGVNRRGQFVAPCARSQFSVQNRHISLAPCGRPGRRLRTSLLFWLVCSGPPERFIQSTAHTINAPRPQGPLRTHTNTQTHLVDATNAAPTRKLSHPHVHLPARSTNSDFFFALRHGLKCVVHIVVSRFKYKDVFVDQLSLSLHFKTSKACDTTTSINGDTRPQVVLLGSTNTQQRYVPSKCRGQTLDEHPSFAPTRRRTQHPQIALRAM